LYDVEDERFVPPVGQDRINQQGNEKTAPSASDGPAPQSLPTQLDEKGGGGSEGESVSELEKGMLLAFKGPEKLSATASSSQRPRRHSVEPSHSQIDQEPDQSVTGYGRLEELRCGTPLRSQDQGEEPPEQQQRQEAVVEAMREEEDDGDNEREPQGEKRGCEDRNKEIGSDKHHSEGSDCSQNTSDEDDEDPRPARRRKLRTEPTKALLAKQLEIARYHLPPWETQPAACWTQDEDYPVQGRMGRISKQISCLGR
jgi:hypothetical protein